MLFQPGLLQNIIFKLEEVLELIETSRLLAAKAAYKELLALKQKEIDSLSKNEKDVLNVRLENATAKFTEMLTRSSEAEQTLHSWNLHDVSHTSDWILGSEFYGVTTHYKVGEDGLLTVRMEALSDDLPIFEQLAVIHEVDLFRDWVPFCSKSELVTKMGHTELAAYFKISAPFMSRDTTLHAYGIDALHEKGLILLIGKSVNQVQGIQSLPHERKSWFHDRIDILDFKTMIEITAPTKAKTTIIAKVDLHCPLPTPIVNFVVRHLAGVILLAMQQQTKKIVDDPLCKHGQRIRHDKAFYTDWLLKKVIKFCEYKSWANPEIKCLGSDMYEAENAAFERADGITATDSNNCCCSHVSNSDYAQSGCCACCCADEEGENMIVDDGCCCCCCTDIPLRSASRYQRSPIPPVVTNLTQLAPRATGIKLVPSHIDGGQLLSKLSLTSDTLIEPTMNHAHGVSYTVFISCLLLQTLSFFALIFYSDFINWMT